MTDSLYLVNCVSVWDVEKCLDVMIFFYSTGSSIYRVIFLRYCHPVSFSLLEFSSFPLISNIVDTVIVSDQSNTH